MYSCHLCQSKWVYFKYLFKALHYSPSEAVRSFYSKFCLSKSTWHSHQCIDMHLSTQTPGNITLYYMWLRITDLRFQFKPCTGSNSRSRCICLNIWKTMPCLLAKLCLSGVDLDGTSLLACEAAFVGIIICKGHSF